MTPANHTLWNFRFSWQWIWRSLTSGLWRCVVWYVCSDVRKDVLLYLQDRRIKKSWINFFHSHVSDLLCYLCSQAKLITENTTIKCNMHSALYSTMIWQHVLPVLSSLRSSRASLASDRGLHSTLYHRNNIKFKMYNYKHIKNKIKLFSRSQFCGTWCHVVW
jgi:hypothetical protein